jgi:hypothetical protein
MSTTKASQIPTIDHVITATEAGKSYAICPVYIHKGNYVFSRLENWQHIGANNQPVTLPQPTDYTVSIGQKRYRVVRIGTRYFAVKFAGMTPRGKMVEALSE